MPIVKVRAYRQVTIPKEIFDKLGLRAGDFVEVMCNKDKIVLEPVDPDDVLTPEEMKLVQRGFAQIQRGEYVTLKELQDELDV